MIVEGNDGRGAGEDGFAKDIARLDDGAVQRPGGDNRGSEDAVLGIEEDDPELFGRS
jgi:hypothetical protein